MDTPIRGRFAPSPSGRMHLGNVYCALAAWLCARSAGGQMVLRVEDLDPARSKAEYARLLQDDLAWLGLTWDEGPDVGGACAPYVQSERTQLYAAAFAQLQSKGLIYPCFCTRADLHAANAPHAADGTAVYSGRCAHLSAQEQSRLAAVRRPSWRVRVQGQAPDFTDGNFGEQRAEHAAVGDCVVRRADGVYAYQLAVTVDDAAMGITQVVRGRDLLASTHIQCSLYRALGLKPPQFFHVPLLCAPDGRRLSKRERDLDMGSLRSRFTAPQLLGLLAYSTGLAKTEVPCTAQQLLQNFTPALFGTKDICIELQRFS